MQRLHQDYIQADSERDQLNDALRRFRNSVGRTVFVKDGDPTAGGTGFTIDDGGGIGGGLSVDGKTKLDPSEIEAALQSVAKRIERLRIERVGD
jgi:hypothetical protein